MRGLGVVFKERTKSRNWACGVFCGRQHDENSRVVGIGFTLFESEHCVLILLGECDVGPCKMRISKRWSPFVYRYVGELS